MTEPTSPPSDSLAGLPYLGASRIAMLRERGIEDLDGLRAMPAEELAKVGFLGILNARRVLAVLNGNPPEPVVRRRRKTAEPADAGEAAAEAAPAEAAPARRTRRTRVAAAAAETKPAEAADAPEPGPDRPRRRRRHREPTAPAGTSLDGTAEEDSRPMIWAEVPSVAAPAAAAPPTADGADYDLALAARRAQLPIVAAGLIEAIRTAAVAPQLGKQTARLMAAVDRLVIQQARLSDRRKRRAALLLNRAHALLEDAANKQRFTQKQQAAVADRLRRRRQQLEQLLNDAAPATGKADGGANGSG